MRERPQWHRDLMAALGLGVVAIAVLGVLGVLSLSDGESVVTARTAPDAAAEPARCTGLLIPSYVSAVRMRELAGSGARKRILILNPESGVGGARERGYVDAVEALRRAGATVLGYVATGYGSRPSSAVRAEIDLYGSWYGVDGIFLDEVAPGEPAVEHYRALSAYVHRTPARTVVLNPGVVPARAYFELADVVVTFEGPYSVYAQGRGDEPSWLSDLAPERTAHLVHTATPEETVAVAERAGGRYVYATTGFQPNPWSTIPPTVDEQEAVLPPCP